MSEDIARYRNLVIEANSSFDPQKVLSYINVEDDEGVILNIKVNKPYIDGVHIDHVSMYIAFDEDDGEGDLGLNYTVDPEIGEPIPDENELMDLFYGGAYDDELSQILMKAGFSHDASQVSGSESGMQEEGRASYDAAGIADEVRDAISTLKNNDNTRKIENMILAHFGINPEDSNLDQHKRDIIRKFLLKVKKAHRVPLVVSLAVNGLKNHGVMWPELDAILMSANATQKSDG